MPKFGCALQYNLRLERIRMTDTTHPTPYEPEPVKTSMEIGDILKILPHRFPFLLIDRVLELVRMKRIVALKNVTITEPFFQGHFPEKPIMPGVLIVEAMAQAGGTAGRQGLRGRQGGGGSNGDVPAGASGDGHGNGGGIGIVVGGQ